MNNIRTLIIDDEHLARNLIKTFLSGKEGFEIIGECEDGFDGFKQINELKPDLVFLDVKMPKLTGFEMLELLEDPPVIIFSTAYDEFAIKAFEQNAADYLLKPYSRDRFNEAIEKARKRWLSGEPNKPKFNQLVHQPVNEELTRIAVRTGHRINILSLDQIRYFEANDDYVNIHTGEGTFLKQQTMKYYEQHLSIEEFVRVHRSYILKVEEIGKIEPMGKDTHVAILQDGKEIPISRSGYAKLKEVLGF